MNEVVRALIEAAVAVALVALQLMGVHGPVQEGQDRVLEGNPRLRLGVDIEGHVVVTLDVHELAVNAQNWRREGLLAEVAICSFPIHIFVLNLILTFY